MKSLFFIKRIISLLLSTCAFGFVFFYSCSENIDVSNYTIKSEQTIADFIESNPKCTLVSKLFRRVRIGNNEKSSNISTLLHSRGNYTLFLPYDDAIKTFMHEHAINNIDSLNEELAQTIAYSCIIDNGNETAYSTDEFPNSGTFKKMNLGNRLLSCLLNSESTYIINGTSQIIGEGTKFSNGYVHIVDKVINPSIQTLDEMIASADNMKIFSFLMKATSWSDSLYENLDLTYENPNRPETRYHDPSGFISWYNLPRHRFIGYTAFVEPDSVYEQYLGLKMELDKKGSLLNGEAFIDKIRPIAEAAYGTKDKGNYNSTNNAINRFVAYHLLDGKISYNQLLHHYNEFHYKVGDPLNPQTANLPVNVWDYYTTKGPNRCILKLTQVGDTGFEHDIEHTIYLNRISNYANGPEEDYHEISTEQDLEGIKIFSTNGKYDNNALNGFYYPINNILIYTSHFRNELFKRRMRIDYVTCLPELYSNNLRGTTYTCFEPKYFNNIKQGINTEIQYDMQQGNMGFSDFQGDGMHFSGTYDYTVKLPPVPILGTYEIRMAGAHNGGRGMVQIYFGDNPQKLLPAGLPYDMRLAPGPENPAIPWIPDGKDWSINLENDKKLRLQGYMKGPNYITRANGNGDMPLRQRGGHYGVVRRIITTATMDPDKTYYLRFKTALKGQYRMQLDFIEYASTAVFNGPKAEDIW